MVFDTKLSMFRSKTLHAVVKNACRSQNKPKDVLLASAVLKEFAEEELMKGGPLLDGLSFKSFSMFY